DRVEGEPRSPSRSNEEAASSGSLSNEQIERTRDLPLILCVARHVAVKNLNLLLRSCAELRHRGEEFRSVLVGDGPCRFDLAAALQQLLEDAALRTHLGKAARARAEEKFSVRRQIDQLLALWSEVLASGRTTGVFVSDPFGARADSSMPTLALALDAAIAKEELKRHLPRLSGKDGKLRLKAIRVIRHKPGRRCVVEYEVRVK